MINDDEEEDYNKLFNYISEKSSENDSLKMKPMVKDDEEFKLENDELFLSELGNILLTNDENSIDGYNHMDESLDDI
jgi:hypothetical protein